MGDQYSEARYGEAVGGRYDDLYPGDDAETASAIALIAGLAGRHADRSVLEMGIGTGRLALGVRDAGVRVVGIDGSPAMVDQLRAKPGGEDIEVVIGDYRDATATGRFAVVLLAINGIFDPRGADAQLDIFRNAARHLVPGGSFVVESWVMHDGDRDGSWSVTPRFVGEEHVELQLARYDIDTNAIERTLVHLRPGGPTFVSVRDTYASPAELDLMGRVTGLTRTARYADWRQRPFTASSRHQVSVFELRP